MSPEVVAIREIVETWMIRRYQVQEFTQRDLRHFIEVHNANTRRLIRAFEYENPEFWSALAELATNAATLTTKGAKIIADGIDRTDV